MNKEMLNMLARTPCQKPERVECYVERASPSLANRQTVSTYSNKYELNGAYITPLILQYSPLFPAPYGPTSVRSNSSLFSGKSGLRKFNGIPGVIMA